MDVLTTLTICDYPESARIGLSGSLYVGMHCMRQ